MSSDGLSSKAGSAALYLGTFLPSISALLIIAFLIANSNLEFHGLTDPRTLNAFALVALICLAGLATGYGIRYLLPVVGPEAQAPAESRRYRDRLARYVVTAGTIGIFATALVLIIVIAVNREDGWRDQAMSVFTSVLPVFSTWVGTVLAFYFTNESFRQAAESSSALVTNPDREPITRPGTMIPFEYIVRHEMPTAFIGDKDPKIAAEAIKWAVIKALLSPGITRVVIFDDKKRPVYVLRPNVGSQDMADGDDLKKYLDMGTSRATAGNFAHTASNATIADARRLLEIRKVTDLFVTEHGRSDQPAMGWVPDYNLTRS